MRANVNVSGTYSLGQLLLSISYRHLFASDHRVGVLAALSVAQRVLRHRISLPEGDLLRVSCLRV